MDVFRFTIPTVLFYGAGSLEKLASEVLPGRKALVVTGGSSLKRLGIEARVLTALEMRGIETVLFDCVTPNPDLDTVMSGTVLARQSGCDFVVGLGGGSSIDAAKAIAMMATNSGNFWDYVQAGTGGKKPFSVPGLPLIAIPTTSGTGTEGNRTAVISNPATGEKMGTACDFPALSLVDPELTLGISKRYTAFQGFDALFHSMEAFIAVRATPVTDAWALESIRLIFENLPAAVKDGSNVTARTNMSIASMLAGMEICCAGCTTAHLIEHALSGLVPTLPHGEGLIMIANAFHRYGAAQIPERYARMADAIGVTERGQTIEEKARSFLAALEELKRACEVDDCCLSAHGFSEADFSNIVKNIYQIAGGKLIRDRYELTEAELMEILRASL